jgi:predicted P-loop ATPase
MACTLTRIDWDYAKDLDPNQVWAQAVALFEAGEPWELTPDEKALASTINGQYEVENPVDQYLFRYFEIDPAQREWVLPTSEIIDVLRRGELGGTDPHRLHQPVAAALRALGLESRQRRFPNYSNPVTAWEGIRVKPQPAQAPGMYGGRSR